MKVKLVRTGILAVVLFVALFVFPPQPAHAAACTFTSTGSGNWNAAIWNIVGSACGAYPGETFAGDTVLISNGHSVTVNVTPANSIASLTFIAGSTTRTFTVNAGVTLNVTGAVTLQNAATNNDSIATIAGAGTINCASVTVGGTETNLTGDNTTSLTSTISNLSISGNLNLNGEDDGNDDNNATFALQSGTVTVGGTLNTDEETGSTVTLTLNTGAETGTLILTGATPFTDAVGTPTFAAAGNNATVIYSGATQTVRATTYTNLTLSGSGTKTPSAGFTVNNNLTIDSGVTLNVAGFTLALSSATLTVNGTLDFTDANGEVQGTSGTSVLTMGANGLIRTLDPNGLGPTNTATNASLQTNGGTFTTSSIDTAGTVEYNRNATSGQIVTDRNYNNLTITGATQTKTWTLGGTRTVNGNLTINSGAPLTLVNAQTVNVLGNWSNSGTFTAGTSTISFNGTSAQTIGGTSATTFNNLTINNANDVTLSQNTTVAGTLALTAGDLIAGNGTNQLSLGCTGAVTSAGGGDVVGDVVRTCAFVAGTNYTFNNPNTLLNFASGGTLPSSMLINLVRTKPPQLQIAVPRTYTLTPTGGSGYSATLRLRYANDELTDMNEIFLRLWRFNGTRYMLQGGAVQTDATNPYVWRSGVTEFSPWAISDNGSVTAVNLSNFAARPDISIDYTIPAFLFSLLGLMAVGAYMLWRI